MALNEYVCTTNICQIAVIFKMIQFLFSTLFDSFNSYFDKFTYRIKVNDTVLLVNSLLIQFKFTDLSDTFKLNIFVNSGAH